MELRKENIIQILNNLSSCFSPSGYEKDASEVFKGLIGSFCDDIREDIMGNIICTKKGKTDRILMLIAHIDEIGMMIKYIEENGFIRFVNIGGVNKHILNSRNVTIMHNNHSVQGIIGIHPPHFTKNNKMLGDFDISDLWIDIGAFSKEVAIQKVSVGDPIRLNSLFTQINEDLIAVGSNDDKCGIAILIALMQLLNKSDNYFTIVCVASVQEEVGSRGAITVANYIHPEIAIAIDVTHATDIPSVNHAKYGKIVLGGGIVIPFGTDYSTDIQNKFSQLAQEHHIQHQIEAIPGNSGTDIHNVQVCGSGCLTGALSIPCRYMHSTVEVVSISDILNGIQLIYEFIKKKGDANSL